jgi:nitrogen fixation NifU-like protein
MSDLRELYQEIIIDHGRQPRNFGPLATANHHQEGYNPICGDKIILHVYEKNGVLQQLQFEGTGCAIAMASASLMTETLKGMTLSEMEKLFLAFHDLVTLGHCDADIGKLSVLSGVHDFPVRVKCATLAWHTLKAALLNKSDPISTE